MAKVFQKLAFLQDYLDHPEKYLPIVDHAWKCFPDQTEFGDHNIGWDVGVISKNRPYFCECWSDGVMVLTYFISTLGIEEYSVEMLEEMLKNAQIVWYTSPRKYSTGVKKFVDGTGHEFFSINIIVGDDDGTYIDGGTIFRFSHLNDFNRNRK